MSTLNQFKSRNFDHPPLWTLWIPEDKYHAEARSGAVVSASMLREFRCCPAHYRALVAGESAPRDSDALRFGRAAHKFILEGAEAFAAAFRVGGPVNEATGRSYGPATRAFADWLRDNGMERKNTVTASEVDTVRSMAQAVRDHEAARNLLSRGWPERSVRVEMERLPCQIRLDWLTPGETAVELKTIENIERFEGDARRFGYLYQLAFYRDVARAAGAEHVAVTVVVVEKKEPHRVGIWNFADETLEPYAVQNRLALASLHRCRAENRWPTGFETPRDFPVAGIPPAWLN